MDAQRQQLDLLKTVRHLQAYVTALTIALVLLSAATAYLATRTRVITVHIRDKTDTPRPRDTMDAFPESELRKGDCCTIKNSDETGARNAGGVCVPASSCKLTVSE